MWCNKFFEKALFPFLFKWSFLLSKWNSLITLLSIKRIHFCIQKFFKRAFVSVRVFWMFVLSLRLMIDENAIDVDGNSLETLLKIFLTLVKRFTLLVISLVPTWIVRNRLAFPWLLHPVALESFHLYHLESSQFLLCS